MEDVEREASASLEDASALRRTPNQRRARERVERILACAAELIAESGSDAMRMSEVARRADISIGSLYQYFSDKAAIVLTLAERYNAEGRACIENGLRDVRTVDELLKAFADLIDLYYGIILAEPVMRDIWSGTQVDNTLREIELAESRINGRALADVLMRLDPKAGGEDLESSAFLLMHLGETAMRLAVSVERDEGDRVIAAFKRMALAELRRMANGGKRS